MNEQYVIEFIRQRMRELGVKCYHFETLFMIVAKGENDYRLENELWYLVDWPQNVLIVSDTTYYNYTGTALQLTSAPEFTGNVTISSTLGGITVQFIRVIIQQV